MRFEKHVKTKQTMAPLAKNFDNLYKNKNQDDYEIIVRESIQNSLDAYKDKNKPVTVKYMIRTFDVLKLLETLDGKKYFDEYKNYNSAMIIRDYNCKGLEGDYEKFLEDESEESFDELNDTNLYKMVYNINLPQEKEGSGGSHGIGKTTFFKLGKGLMFLYTRIEKEKNKFEERLLGLCVEKEPKLFTKGNLSAGIAFYGKKTDDRTFEIKPIIDNDAIHEFTSIFKIDKYKDDETGTTIIMPFLDVENNKKQKEEFDNKIEQIEKYVKKNYFPRLNNERYQEEYKMPLLNVYTSKEKGSEKKVTLDDEPLYEKFQKLYNNTFDNNNTSIIKHYDKYDGLKLGFFSWKVFSYDELDVERAPNNNKKPYEQLEIEETNNIIMWTRKPGMINRFQANLYNKGLQIEEKENLISIFRLNSDDHELEEYVRKGEREDHVDWEDMNVKPDNKYAKSINRIKSQIKKKVSESVNAERDTQGRKDIATAKLLGSIVMPSEDFGNFATGHREAKSKSRKTKGKKTTKIFDGKDPKFQTNNGILQYSQKITMHKEHKMEIIHKVYEGEKQINFSKWEEVNELPVQFLEGSIKQGKIEENAKMDDGIISFLGKEGTINIILKYKIINPAIDIDISIHQKNVQKEDK